MQTQSHLDINKEHSESSSFNTYGLESADSLLLLGQEQISRPETRYGFRINDTGFLVPKHTQCEVVSDHNIYLLPNSPAWIHGLINLRSNIIPVINFSRIIAGRTDKQRDRKLLIIGKGEDALAILVDRLPMAITVNDLKETTQAYPAEFSDYVYKTYRFSDSYWYEFNIKKYVDSCK